MSVESAFKKSVHALILMRRAEFYRNNGVVPYFRAYSTHAHQPVRGYVIGQTTLCLRPPTPDGVEPWFVGVQQEYKLNEGPWEREDFEEIHYFFEYGDAFDNFYQLLQPKQQ